MTKEKLKIAVRFFGGAGHYTEVLREMFAFIVSSSPSEHELLEWVKSNTRATSDDGIRRRLSFLEGIELLEIKTEHVRLTENGIRWLSNTDPAFLYEILATQVHGFDTILEALLEGPKTDGELGDAIKAAHPEFGWIDDSGPAQHRGWLQSLGYVERSDGVNRLTPEGRGFARQLKRSTEPQLTIGETYTKRELEDEFQTSFGAYIKGINPRTDDDGKLDYIVLKARENGPYGDDLEGDQFTYIGEGVPEKGDQKQTAANRYLLEQVDHSSVPVYFFFQPAETDELRYEGLVDVVDTEYISDGVRRVYRFTMERLEVGTEAELEALRGSVIENSSLINGEGGEKSDDHIGSEEPPLTEDDEEYTTVQRRVRSSEFESVVKDAYNGRCAICGTRRESITGTFEVEAAHIYPRSENGRNNVQNGLALCKLHHWAFDCGWLAISDDYRILVADEPDLDGYDDFAPLAGQTLTIPDNEDLRPHATYLAAHRALYGYE